jgi:hypothetical protein
MAGVLNFSQYLGGPDNVNVEQVFPRNQQILQYNFGVNITGWTFDVDAQTVVVDAIAYTRDNVPNFADSSIIGYMPSQQVSTSSYVTVLNQNIGTVNITVPGGLYNGPILADARKNVPITVVSVSWTTPASSNPTIPSTTNSHRWAFIMCWEPGIIPADPTLVATTVTGYTAVI